MANTLDFNKAKKHYLTIKLPDEKGTTLLVLTPTKGIMEELILLQQSAESVQDEGDIEAMDNLYSACARIMSRNKGGIHITKELLEDILDFEDILIFFRSYMEFIDGISRGKN